jgi:DNA-binding Xre family transcriptional regulator
MDEDLFLQMNSVAERFLGTLGPRKERDLGGLNDLLTSDERESIETCIEKYTYREYADFASLIVSDRPIRLLPLAQLQLLIGLGEGRVSQQVQEAVFREMNKRDWVWHTERDNVKHTPLAKETGVSNPQIHRFLTGGENGVVKTSTLDRISQVVKLELITWGESGRVYGALDSVKSRHRTNVFPDDAISVDKGEKDQAGDSQEGTVTQQLRRALKGLIERRGWTQNEMASWTGVSQSQICRFLLGGELKTVALDRLGAFLWVEIVPRTECRASTSS